MDGGKWEENIMINFLIGIICCFFILILIPIVILGFILGIMELSDRDTYGAECINNKDREYLL